MDLDDLYNRACAAVERANYEYAVRLLRQVLSEDPGYANARHVLRATERRRLEETGKSPLAGVLWPAHALVALARAELAKGSRKLEVYEDYLEKHPSSSWGAFQLAHAAEEAGLKEEAIGLYDDALKVDPASARALRSITDLLKAMHRVPEALPYLQRLAEQKPDDRDLQKELRDLEATEHMVSHKMEEARSFRELIRDKDEAERLEEERREAVSMDDLRAEIVRLEGELEDQPEHVNRILRLARLYQDTTQYDKALEFLKEKNELLPDNYEVHERLGDVQLAIYERAIAAGQARLQESPDNEELRGKIDQLRTRRSELGIREFTWRRAEHPTDRGVILELGRHYFDAGQYNDAIAAFQEAAQEARYAGTAIPYLGRSFLEKGQYDLAVEQFNRAIEEHPEMDEKGKAIRYYKAQALEAMGDEQEALGVYKKIYSQDINYRDVAQKVDALSA